MSAKAPSGPSGHRKAKKDEKQEDKNDADFWEALDQAISVPCMAGTLSGLLLFTILSALAYKQIGKPAHVAGRKPVFQPSIPNLGRWKINYNQPVASWAKTQLEFALEDNIRYSEIGDGELYSLGSGLLHRIDSLRDFQSDLVRMHGKMMARGNTDPDVGPYWAIIEEEEVPWYSQLVYEPKQRVLVLIYATKSGSLLCSRLHVGINPTAKEAWERGSQWSPREHIVKHEVADERGSMNRPDHVLYHVHNPVASYDPHSEVLRVMYTGVVHENEGFIFMTSSMNSGVTWTWPEKVYSVVGRWSLPNMLRLSESNYILPILRESQSKKAEPGSATIGVLLSEDHATTFQEYEMSEGHFNYAWHSSMVKLNNGDVLQYMSFKDDPHVRVAKSTDGGRTWEKSVRTEIPSPGPPTNKPEAGGPWHSATVLKSGKVALLFVNHEATTTKEYVQSPLTIAISADEKGMAFPFVRDLEVAYRAQLGGKRATYENGFRTPSLVQANDGYLHIAYSCIHSREKHPKHFIKYVVIDEAWVVNGEKASGGVSADYPSMGTFQGTSNAW